MELHGFYNYDVHTLRPRSTEIGGPELNNVGEKPQDKNDIILHNTIINERLNQTADMIQGFIPLFWDS